MKKTRNMVDEEEMEDEDETEETESEEEEQEESDETNEPMQSRKVISKSSPPVKSSEPKVQIVEREITLSLINEKLNFIISQLSK